MKKAILIILCLCLVLCILTGCSFKGYDFVDTNYSFDRAIIKMPDGTVKEVNIIKWADSADGEQITITTEDATYLVNSINCILIKDVTE